LLENDKDIHISGIGGDAFGIDVSGEGNVIGKNISITETVNLDDDMLKEVPHLYAEALKNFCQSINQQLTNHNIQKSQLSRIQESINQLARETEGVKVDQEISVPKSTSIKIRLINVARNTLKILPKTAETVALFTPLAPFSRLVGEVTQSLVEHVQKEV
jgi:hypothetical protein